MQKNIGETSAAEISIISEEIKNSAAEVFPFAAILSRITTARPTTTHNNGKTVQKDAPTFEKQKLRYVLFCFSPALQ